MPNTAYLLDSNILIRWIQPDDRDYPVIKSALDVLVQQQSILCYTSQNLAEFWNACTRPVNRNGYGLTSQEADRRARILESRLRLLPDNIETHQEWRQLLVSHNVSGVQVYDARLVAAMRVHGVQSILTLNVEDFRRYPSIEALHPAAVPK